MSDHVRAQKKTARPAAAAPAAKTADPGPLRVPTPGERQQIFGQSVRDEASRRNRTGLPDRLKSGVESLSGLSLDDVKVHYGSARPAVLGAHAFTQGSAIHVAPGQERHVPHEAWHVVQQKQRRVRATRQMKSGVKLNEDCGLEREADAMGARALRVGGAAPVPAFAATPASTIQLKPLVAGPDGKMVDVAAADAAEVAAVLDGFWAGKKKGKITEAVSVAALQRPDVVTAVSAEVEEDMINRVLAKPRLLVELIGDLWKQGAKALKAALPKDLADAAAKDSEILAQLKGLGGHRLVNAVQRTKTGDAKAAVLPKAAQEFAQENIEKLTFDEALTEAFKTKHVAQGTKISEAAEEAHASREETRSERVAKTSKKIAPKKKEKKKALRSADRAVSTRFLFPDNEQTLIVAELKELNQTILARREANPRAIFRLTKNAYSYVSAYKQQGQETGRARFWFTILGSAGAYQINHLDALVDG